MWQWGHESQCQDTKTCPGSVKPAADRLDRTVGNTICLCAAQCVSVISSRDTGEGGGTAEYGNLVDSGGFKHVSESVAESTSLPGAWTRQNLNLLDFISDCGWNEESEPMRTWSEQRCENVPRAPDCWFLLTGHQLDQRFCWSLAECWHRRVQSWSGGQCLSRQCRELLSARSGQHSWTSSLTAENPKTWDLDQNQTVTHSAVNWLCLSRGGAADGDELSDVRDVWGVRPSHQTLCDL